jgi:hypothetical protein
VRRREPSFWTAQLLGWGGYAVASHLLSLGTLTDGSLAGHLDHVAQKLVKAGLGAVFSVGLYAVYERVWPRRLSFPALGLLGVAASFAAGTLWLVAFRGWLSLSDPGHAPFSDFARESLNYGVVLLAWSALYFSFSYRRDLEVETERALRATALAAEARLRMLRYQVNPHFLFNALNSIRALVDEDPGRARLMVTQLAEFFRYSLLNTQVSEMPLGDEIQAIRSYLAIQKIRFEERLEVAFDVDADAERVVLPGFLVHPLVENAVKYGTETSARPLRLSLGAKLTDGTLRLEVANTGRLVSDRSRGPGPAPGTGTGLDNVKQRLAQAFPDRHRFQLDERDGWVRASLEIRLTEARR